MKINIEELDNLVKESDAIFISPEGEEVLVKLLKLRQQIDDAIDIAEEKLEQKALELDENFKSIQSDKIKVSYRLYGYRYSIDDTRINEIPKHLFNTSVKYSANTDEIDKYVEQGNNLPLGIIENDRKKSLKFTLKNEI